jgi:hypothetical protein
MNIDRAITTLQLIKLPKLSEIILLGLFLPVSSCSLLKNRFCCKNQRQCSSTIKLLITTELNELKAAPLEMETLSR